MEEGANQGCLILASLDVLVLGEVLKSLDVVMKARAHNRFLAGDNGDDGEGVESHLMGYIDDVRRTVTPHIDTLFFFEDSNCLGRPLVLHLNPFKTRIVISTSGNSPVVDIQQEYHPKIAAALGTVI